MTKYSHVTNSLVCDWLQLYDKSTASRKLYSTDSICCGFVVESTTNPQHIDKSRCGFVEKLWICRKAVDLLWICRKAVDLLWICCGFAVQQVVQQIYNKSNKWSLSSMVMNSIIMSSLQVYLHFSAISLILKFSSFSRVPLCNFQCTTRIGNKPDGCQFMHFYFFYS